MADTHSTTLGARTPLILLPPTPSLDAVCAAYALSHFFETRTAHPVITCTDTIHDSATFLKKPQKSTTTIRGLQDFIIQFDTTHNAIDDIEISREEKTVHIIITPQNDFIDPRDFSFAPSRLHYDAIFLVGTDTLEATKLTTPENLSLLEELPRTVYVSSPKAPIISMHVYEDLWRFSTESVTGAVAHDLLAGIVAATDGLRSETITADIFRTGSTLMQSGGDLQAIMLALYKTVSFDFLRSWGDVLDKLTLSPSKRVAAAFVTKDYDIPLLSLILQRTAQFLPHVHIFGIFWTLHTTPQITQGVILPTHTISQTLLEDIFSTVSPAPHNCFFVTSSAKPQSIITHIDAHLERQRE